LIQGVTVKLPGACVSVLTYPAQPEEALIVPVAAIQTDQKSDYVLVVGADNKVLLLFVHKKKRLISKF
jgi:multidrug efflux pump subunit AcrA (membrane-fusion protein)